MKLDIDPEATKPWETQLRRGLNGEYREKAARKFGDWHYIKFSREGGLPEIKILAGPDGSAVRTLRRRKNGAIDDSMGRENSPDEHRNLYYDYKDELVELHKSVKNMLNAEAISDLGTRKYARLCNEQNPAMDNVVTRTAEYIVHTQATLCIMPGGPRPLPWSSVPKEVNRLIRTHLLDTGTTRLLREVSREQVITAPEYNRAMRNRQGLEATMERSPDLARLYFQKVAGNRRGPRTADGILREIASRWEIPEEDQPFLTALSGDHYIANGKHHRETITAVCRCLRATGIGPEHVNTSPAMAVRHHAGIMTKALELGHDAETEWLSGLPELIGEYERIRTAENQYPHTANRKNWMLSTAHVVIDMAARALGEKYAS